MRRKAKGVLFALFGLTTLLLLSACGGPESHIADIEKLQEDLSEQSLFKNYADMLDISISDLEVIKRQTTVEDETDQAWVHVDVSGPRVEGDMYYLMTYELYNDGWLLENVIENDRNQWHFVPLEGPTEDVWSWMLGNAENINTTLDLEAGYGTVTWQSIDYYEFCEATWEKAITTRFDSNNGFWYCAESEPQRKGLYEQWHIDGTWECNSSGTDSKITITGFDAAVASLGNVLNGEGTFAVNISGTVKERYEGTRTVVGPCEVNWSRSFDAKGRPYALNEATYLNYKNSYGGTTSESIRVQYDSVEKSSGWGYVTYTKTSG